VTRILVVRLRTSVSRRTNARLPLAMPVRALSQRRRARRMTFAQITHVTRPRASAHPRRMAVMMATLVLLIPAPPLEVASIRPAIHARAAVQLLILARNSIAFKVCASTRRNAPT